jgi:phosphoglycolate phosphatase-like HAD superfamily hydrolase
MILLFDFDGTLADSLLVLLLCINNNADYYGYNKITDVESLRNKDAHEIIKELNMSLFKVPFIVNTVRNQVREKMHEIKPIAGVPEMLRQLHEKGVVLGIITSNSAENVKIFLQNNNLDIFTYIHGESSIFGKSAVLKNFLKKHALDPADVVYVGDEVRDIEAAKANTIKSAAVTWGFNKREKLEEQKPDYIINTPGELLILKPD